VRFDDGNVRVYASQFPGGSEFAPKVQAGTAMLQSLAALHAQLALQAEDALAKFLRDNHADYPGYGASGLYSPGTAFDPNEGTSTGRFFMA
jgi:hypothetical protein